MAKVIVRLTAYNMGDASEDAFDAWVAYVDRHLEARAGFPVDVDAYPYRHGPEHDRVSGATDDQATTVRDALTELWEAWCEEGAPGVG